MINYHFSPIGPHCLKERAELIAGKYGGKVVEMSTLQFGTGFYIVPLDYEVSK